MLFEAFLGLIDAGILKREVDGVVLHGAFFLGPKSFYRALREMTPEQLARIQMMPVSFTNELYGDEAGKRRARVDARFVNNAMMATLLGAVISDGLENGQVVSGVGGQYNFVAQAFALRRRAFDPHRGIDAAGGAKAISNIRWSYGHETIPRHLRDIVITEYGVADLRGKSDADVIAAMLAVTDSRFQTELMRQAKDAGKLARNYEIPAAASRQCAGAHRGRIEAGARGRPAAVIPVRKRFHRRRAAADSGAAAVAGSHTFATASAGITVGGILASAGRRRQRLPGAAWAGQAGEAGRTCLSRVGRCGVGAQPREVARSETCVGLPEPDVGPPSNDPTIDQEENRQHCRGTGRSHGNYVGAFDGHGGQGRPSA